MKGAGQTLNTLSIQDGSPLGPHTAESIREGHRQEVSGVNNGLVMPQGGKKRDQQGQEQEVEQRKVGYPSLTPLNLEGGWSPEAERGFYQMCPLVTQA